MHRHELTEGQWRQLEPLLPRHGRRPVRGDRTFINLAIVHLAWAVHWLKAGS